MPTNIARYFNSRTLVERNLGNPIELSRFIKENYIYASQGEIYLNLDQINLTNPSTQVNDSSNGNYLKINNIVIDDDDFYLATDIGVFKNYKRIFSKEECFHIEKSSKKIFISCTNGLYHSDYDSRNPYADYNWQVYISSPASINYFTLNSSRTNPEYVSAANGFYYYDARKHKWFRQSQNLSRDFNGSYGFGRFIVEKINKDLDQIYLPSSIGLMVSKDNGKTWIKNNSGLENDPNGFYSLREIKKYYNSLLLASSTGLYIANSNDKILHWSKISIAKLRKDQNLNENIYSIDIQYSRSKNKSDLIIISNSEGQILGLEENFNPIKASSTIEAIPNTLQEQKIISNDPKFTATVSKQEDKSLINKLLSCEPRIQELHKAAIEFTGIPSGKQFNSYRRQARLRNLLPELEGFADNRTQNYLALESTGKDNYDSGDSSIVSSLDRANVNRNDEQITSGFQMNWKLNNLIYDPEVNDINTSARITANIRENILNEITQLYFQRKELLFKVLNSTLDDSNNQDHDNQFQDKIKLEEFTAQIDARTDSWFSDKLASNFVKIAKSLPDNITEKIKELYLGTSI